jgi:hypothetical protein
VKEAMPGFSAEVPHQLGKQAATDRLKDFLPQVKQRYADQINEVDGSWQDNVLSYRLTTYGIKIDGTLTVEDDAVKLQGNLPLAAMMFKGRISDSMRSAIERALAV